jgi:putative tryptophan/tyrosine transport system substrate-binding protein
VYSVTAALTSGEQARAVAAVAVQYLRLGFDTKALSVAVSEPVTRGFVESLAHPGGNITGFTNLEPTMGAKWLQLLKQIAPAVARVAVMLNPESGAGVPFFYSIKETAEMFGVKAFMLPIHDPSEIASAIEVFAREPDGGLINVPDGFSYPHRAVFVRATAHHRLPAIYPATGFADVGGLVSYAVDFAEQYRLAGEYVDRILRGEKPADLRVQQPTKFELVINLKAAKALGLSVPGPLFALADEVIE